MINNLYLGVDIGGKGGVSFFRNNENVLFDFIYFRNIQYRNLKEVLLEKLNGYDNVVCCIENVHFVKGDGGVGTFSFGQQFGWIESLFYTLNIPYLLIEPRVWKKHFDCIVTKKEKDVLSKIESKKLKKQKVVDFVKKNIYNNEILDDLMYIKLKNGNKKERKDIEFYDSIAIGKFCQEKFYEIINIK